MAGTIGVSSKPGEGAAFDVTLPLRRPEPEGAQNDMKIIEQMLSAAQYNRGMDIVIISTTSAMQEVYWQQRPRSEQGGKLRIAAG